ncbi:MAG TPA: NAD-dependent epimerase/dehydratase family protein, partial [Frankiaceae bacterium]|nr:NAD-dependent epimerase/dehydratase family protein [Frankiaceae bacterium]
MLLLVTGGAGFIGANFVHYTLRTHPEHSIVVLDALTYAGNEASLAPVRGRIEFVRGSVADA